MLTRQRDWPHPGVDVIHTLDDARTLLRSGNVVLAGGGELYAELLDEIDTLELTEIHREVDGDARFPDVDPAIWRETARGERDGFAWVELPAPATRRAGGPTGDPAVQSPTTRNSSARA